MYRPIAQTRFLTENTTDDPYMLQQGECQQLINAEFIEGNRTLLRRGIGGGTSNGPVLSLGQVIRQLKFGRLRDGTEFCVVGANTVTVYVRTPGTPPTWTAKTASATVTDPTTITVDIYQEDVWAAFDGTLYFYDFTTNAWYTAGLSAPGTAPTVAAGTSGTLAGDFKYVVTFVRTIGDRTAISNPSPETSVVTLANEKAHITSIPTGPSGTTGREIYRAKRIGNTSSWDQFQYVTCILDNVTTTYDDDTSDISSNKALESDHGTPPTDIQTIHVFKDWMVLGRQGDLVQISRTQEPEHFPASYQVALDEGRSSGGNLVCINSDENYIYVFKPDTTKRLVPTGDAVAPLLVNDLSNIIGTINHSSVAPFPGGLLVCGDESLELLTGGDYQRNFGQPEKTLYKSLRDASASDFANMRVISRPDLYSIMIAIGNTIIIWNWQANRWYRWTLANSGWKVTAIVDADQSTTNDLLIMAVNRGTGTEGDIGEFPQSTLNDFGSTYQLSAKTGELGEANMIVNFRQIVQTHGGGSGTLTFKTYVNGTLKDTISSTVSNSAPTVNRINRRSSYLTVEVLTSDNIPLYELTLKGNPRGTSYRG